MWLWAKSCCGWKDQEFHQGRRKNSQGFGSRGIENGRGRNACGTFSIVFILMPWVARIFGMLMFVDGFMPQNLDGGSSQLSYIKRCDVQLWKEIKLVKRSYIEEKSPVGVFELKMTDKDLYGEEDEMDGEEIKEGDVEGKLGDPEILNVGDNDDSSAVTLGDLSWRVEKLRLEEANTRRFLKSRPRFLPYEECRKWVKAWHRWESEEEWNEWIDEG